MKTNTKDLPSVDSDSLFCLFAGHCYYPRGGAGDFRATGTMAQLKELYAKNADRWSQEEGGYPDPWGHIADVKTMRVVCHTRGKEEWVDGAE